MSKGNIILPGPGGNVPRHMRRAMQASESAETKQMSQAAMNNTQILRQMVEQQGRAVMGNQEATAVLLLHVFGTDEDRERVADLAARILPEARKMLDMIAEQQKAMQRAAEAQQGQSGPSTPEGPET